MANIINITDEKYNMALAALNSGIKIKKPTVSTLNDIVKYVYSQLVPGFVRCGLLPKEFEEDTYKDRIIDELTERYEEKIGIEVLTDKTLDKSDFHSWLPEKIESGKLKWDSWSKYKKYVLEFSGKYSDESISAIDDISTKVVDRMGNPASPKSDFPTYGLLMGDVQSGKTATYTGICHKAIDAGYRFIIVLTGTKDSLRIQTQVRLDKDLRNFQTNSEGHQRQIIDSWKSSYTWRLLTTPENDFNISKLDTSIPPSTSKQVVLAVVKKIALY